ncbi:MAG: hypothetical protein WBF32_03410, partial [Candidatus Aminicenantaceae bacterium]
ENPVFFRLRSPLERPYMLHLRMACFISLPNSQHISQKHTFTKNVTRRPYRSLLKNHLKSVNLTFISLDYSRTEANPPHPYNKVEEVAHEAVVNYREPTQPNPGYNEADVVRWVG